MRKALIIATLLLFGSVSAESEALADVFAVGGKAWPTESGGDVSILGGAWTHSTESTGNATAVAGTFALDVDGSEPYADLEIDDASPLNGGGNYLDAFVEKNGTSNYRAERRWQLDPDEATYISVGGDDYVASDSYWYGFLFRVNEVTLASPSNDIDRTTHLTQFHNEDFGVSPSLSPPFSIRIGSLGGGETGIVAYLEANDDFGGDSYFSSKLDDYDVGTTKALLIHVQWDTRSGVSSTGFADVYIVTSPGDPGNPVWEWDGQTSHGGDNATANGTQGADIPYWKVGIYASSFRTGDTNGDTYHISYDNFITASGTGTDPEGFNNAVWNGTQP